MLSKMTRLRGWHVGDQLQELTSGSPLTLEQSLAQVEKADAGGVLSPHQLVVG